MTQSNVKVRQESVTLPTYEPHAPDKHPMFLEKRVYQGSSGKVYPLPVYNRIANHKTDRSWKAVFIENQYVSLMILPELGGRIHVGQDKTNGYDFFYRQNVIKPALVGLTGPWISGGVEFNWPQHHRPATYMPTQVEIENHTDGSKTVWLSDHDPLTRMKGMHGVCLHPDKALVELKVRAYNRTSQMQTFLWWANVGVRVHEAYQSFFPIDVSMIADHAKRATSKYPLCDESYYGVEYGKLAGEMREVSWNEKGQDGDQKRTIHYPANDLTWYANIPVPTSYMCVNSDENFFGGYDHYKDAGLIHYANRHISPGKKQWTWGNHEFGYAWDRHLTDSDGPYIELMAGVYTDNQPDFSFLQPGETKSWSQYWYPIQKIGPAQMANLRAAVSLVAEGKRIKVGVSVTQNYPGAEIQLSVNDRRVQGWTADLAPGQSFVEYLPLPTKTKIKNLALKVLDQEGGELIHYIPKKRMKQKPLEAATEPKAPREISSSDELYLTGLHLEQYRHATRSPELYWQEALRRDPGDSRCLNAMGLSCFKRGEFKKAKDHFTRAVVRLVAKNPNPYDGEAYYNLGQTLVHLKEYEEAYAAFYKSTWNQAWQSAAYHALSELDCRRGDWETALDHLDHSLRFNTDNLRARDLRVIVLRKLDHREEAQESLNSTLKLDPLDVWARRLSGQSLATDVATLLDLAIDYTRAGLYEDALELLAGADETDTSGGAPLIQYYRGYLHSLLGGRMTAVAFFKKAAEASPDYCFPFRLEEIDILQTAMKLNPKDAKAPYYLGNLLYDKMRHEEGIALWEKSVALDPTFPVVWRNLGIGYFNVSRKPAKALAAFDRAYRENPGEARILYERDQLWKRMGKTPTQRLKELEKRMDQIRERDDLSVELCALYNQTGQSEKALEILGSRHFQPWEGGEGLALGQHVRTHVSLGREALQGGDYALARGHFESALNSPKSLGESKHLLANQSDIHYWLGVAFRGLGEKAKAAEQWQTAASYQGDFQKMSVLRFSEMTYYTARSLESLGKKSAARKLDRDLLSYAKQVAKTQAKIDYFATSLPTMLLFDEDLQAQQKTQALFLEALAELGLGRSDKAVRLFKDVLKRDPNHPAAADFLKNSGRKAQKKGYLHAHVVSRRGKVTALEQRV